MTMDRYRGLVVGITLDADHLAALLGSTEVTYEQLAGRREQTEHDERIRLELLRLLRECIDAMLTARDDMEMLAEHTTTEG